MAHRRRVSSARPASRSPACPNRAPYHRRALWTCPACGRPVRIVLHPQSGDTGAHSPLEISRATAGDRAGAEAARFPQFHSAFLSIYSHGKPRHDLNPKALTCPQNRGNLTPPTDVPDAFGACPQRVWTCRESTTDHRARRTLDELRPFGARTPALDSGSILSRCSPRFLALSPVHVPTVHFAACRLPPVGSVNFHRLHRQVLIHSRLVFLVLLP